MRRQAKSILTSVAILATCFVANANIHDTALAHGSLSSFVAALDVAGIVNELSGAGPFTVFAPTNSAFGNLQAGLFECLLREDDLRLLKSILLYHVAEGPAIFSQEFKQGQSISTVLPGTSLSVDVMDFLKINDSAVVGVDLVASNGVIHAINSVLIPPGADIDGFLSDCQAESASSEAIQDIPSTAAASGNFNTLLSALTAASLIETLSTPGPSTVFAPTDDAFASLPENLVQCLLLEENLPVLSSILRYHVVGGAAVLSTDLSQGQFVPTLLDREVVEVELIDGAFDVPTARGGAISVAMRGGSIKINGANVVNADVLASNGVIHAIDSVLIPPGVDIGGFLTACRASLGTIPTKDIPTTVAAAGNLNTLVVSLVTTGLTETIGSPEGPFTVFAPTDDAFASLPKNIFPCLLLMENLPILASILRYHVVGGAGILSTDLSKGQLMPTLLDRAVVEVDVVGGGAIDVPTTAGGAISVAMRGGSIKINDAEVVDADVLASNGVIHAIDSVLFPPGFDAEEFLSTCPDLDDSVVTLLGLGLTTMVEALSVANLLDEISAPDVPVTIFAPTNEAFAALPEGLLDCWLGDAMALSGVLRYHVAEGIGMMSQDLGNGKTIPTTNGGDLTVSRTGGSFDVPTANGGEISVAMPGDRIKINGAKIVGMNHGFGTGSVVHAIDSVLLPDDIDVTSYLQSCSSAQGSSGERHHMSRVLLTAYIFLAGALFAGALV